MDGCGYRGAEWWQHQIVHH